MSKINDQEFKGFPIDLIDFKDDVRDLLNNGKYQVAVTTLDPPAYNANPGELSMVLAGGSAALYAAYSTNTWIKLTSVVTTGTVARSVSVLFTTSALGVSSNSTTENELVSGIVGTTSLAANSLLQGKTVHLRAGGYYNTQVLPDTLRVSVLLGTTTMLTTTAQTPAGSVSTAGWFLNADLTCQTTGGSGTVFSQGEFPHFTSVTVFLNWEMTNGSPTTVDTTVVNPVRILAQWGGANAANQIYMTNCIAEIIN